ncbi:MAG: LysE family transporter [Bacteroidetes bacterium]|nr:LysE family transporter [Bacteroidota bacterium]
MTESLFTMSLVALIVGFIFSMPIAGPISILITSNALKGRMRYCVLATIGASFADFIYVFIAVFGLTKLYSLYKPIIPYVLLAGAVFLLYIGFKIAKTKLNLDHLDEKQHHSKKITKERSGFWTGFMLNFLNPTLFIGWLTSSFFVISMVASLGFNTGGMDTMIDQNVQQINNIEGKAIDTQKTISYLKVDSINTLQKEIHKVNNAKLPNYFPLIISICYAFFLALGSIIWFYYLSYFLVKYRTKLNVVVMNRVIQCLGIALCLFGLFLGYSAIKMFI